MNNETSIFQKLLFVVVCIPLFINTIIEVMLCIQNYNLE